MASKVIEEFLKKAKPHERAAIEQSAQRLQEKKAAVQAQGDHQFQKAPQTQEPTASAKSPELKAEEPKLADSAQLKPSEWEKQPNAMDRALSNSAKTQTAEQGKNLQKQNVKTEKEPER